MFLLFFERCSPLPWRLMATWLRAVQLAASLLVCLLCGFRPAAAAEPAAVDFVRDVQPIFVEHCYQCHGPDTQQAGLRLDLRERALAGGDSGAWFVAGRPDDSELIRRITATDEERMPPVDGQSQPLSAEQVQTMQAWIEAGATWPQAAGGGSNHWAFQPIARPAPPSVQNEAWVRTPIDRFVLARLEARGLSPAAPADRATLIKRLSYDLLGLPPSTAEVDAFLADTSADAYERLVDRLLDSPRFGERFGRHWLDKARYADSDGYEKDNPRPDAWRYRDWVIAAVNRDVPLDRFTLEQLAGDLLPGAGPEERLATAFHRQTLTNTEGGVDPEQFRVEAIFDRVATTGTVWLGLTIGCAQCHTHKYDPITHTDYYRLFAFFNNGDETETEVPLVGEPLAVWQRELDDARNKLDKLVPRLEKLRSTRAAELAAWEAELRAAPASNLAYHPVELVQAESQAGAEIKLLSDGSYLVTGKNPDVDRLRVVVKADQAEVTGIRLDVLPHDSLGGGGPGRAGHGNFVLSEVKLSAGVENSFSDEQRVVLKTAEADYQQDNHAAQSAIDNNDRTGWAVAGQTGQPHFASFYTDQPLDTRQTPWLEITLSQNYGSQHTLGRFRISAITGSDPQRGIPQPVREVLAIAPAERSESQHHVLVDYYVRLDKQADKLTSEVAALRKRVKARPVMNARVLSQRTQEPRASHILARGDFLDPQTEVQPGTPEVLPSLAPRGAAGDRLDLARFLVDPANPLTRRVLVNQLWSHLFGRGIVRTLNDFGVRGDRPTHPELLDWLAVELAERGWSRKQLLKQMLTSATYRQSSATRPELNEIDPLNDLFHRQNRQRVEAEIVRDLTLSAAGLLADKVGGPSVFPPMPSDIAALSYANNFKWNESTGADRYRRGMYTFFKRTAPFPDLTTFDCPDANTTCVERRTSNTPLQALTTLNNESYLEAAQAMARRALQIPADDDAHRLSAALRWCIARVPQPHEVAALAELLTAGRQWYADHPDEATAAVGTHACEGASLPENAAWVATVRMMLNLDEFLTRE